jgi:hypothetical protein
MSNEPETKVCPKCAGSIKAQARLCPHCRSSQKGIGVWRDQILCGVILVSWAALAGFFCAFFDPFSSGGRVFWLHQKDLDVCNVTLQQTMEHNMRKCFLTGYVTNRGDRAWRVQELEVRFVDKSGQLRDVTHADGLDFVVTPKHQWVFRFVLYNVVPTNDEVREVVRVSDASDPDFNKGRD